MNADKITAQLATLTEQGRWQAQQTHEIKSEIKDIKKSVENLNAFKFKIMGMAALVVAVIEIARAKG